MTTLFEDTTPIGGEGSELTGARLAYGYPGADGRVRTGILTAFVRDGQGFIIDLDGLQTEEEALLAIANSVAANWRFTSPGAETPTADWGNAVLSGYDVAYPPGLTFEDVNGWYRFVSRERFIAVRTQPAARTLDEAMAALLAAAGEGVEGFEVTLVEPLSLSGNLWQRARFTYVTAVGTPIAGRILVGTDSANEMAVWSEWPSDENPERDAAAALAVAASMQPHIESEGGN